MRGARYADMPQRLITRYAMLRATIERGSKMRTPRSDEEAMPRQRARPRGAGVHLLMSMIYFYFDYVTFDISRARMPIMPSSLLRGPPRLSFFCAAPPLPSAAFIRAFRCLRYASAYAPRICDAFSGITIIAMLRVPSCFTRAADTLPFYAFAAVYLLRA